MIEDDAQSVPKLVAQKFRQREQDNIDIKLKTQQLICAEMVAASPAEIRLAYRHLYQGLLRAVQYAKPARYIVRDRLRAGFEEQSGNSFEPKRIANTLEFLNGAAKTRGLEHKILKNLVLVYWGESSNRLYTP